MHSSSWYSPRRVNDSWFILDYQPLRKRAVSSGISRKVRSKGSPAGVPANIIRHRNASEEVNRLFKIRNGTYFRELYVSSQDSTRQVWRPFAADEIWRNGKRCVKLTHKINEHDKTPRTIYITVLRTLNEGAAFFYLYFF